MTIRERIQANRDERIRRQNFLNKLNAVEESNWKTETYLQAAELQEEIDELNRKIDELNEMEEAA